MKKKETFVDFLYDLLLGVTAMTSICIFMVEDDWFRYLAYPGILLAGFLMAKGTRKLRDDRNL